jgi:uncharacterized membrane protein YeaQ/YmgE (transglycosylase-associated protein family)
MSNTAVNDEILRLQSITNFFSGYCMLALIGVGTVGNLLNIFVFIRLKTLRRMTNSVFLIGSFTGSLILLWSSRFPTSILTITGVNPLVGSIVYCKIRWLFGRWGLNMPFTCVCLASIDRFLITSRNASFRRFFTLKRAYILVMIFSLAYLAICMPDAIYYSGYSCTASATARATYKQFITYFNLIVTNILSMSVLGTFSILTWYNLWSGGRGGHNRLQQQVNTMMLVEFSMAFITTLPNFVYNIYSQATQSVVKSPLRTAQESLWSIVSTVLSFTIHVGTFYAYVIVSPAYRRNVRTALCLKKQNRVTSEHIQLQNGTTVHTVGNTATRP